MGLRTGSRFDELRTLNAFIRETLLTTFRSRSFPLRIAYFCGALTPIYETFSPTIGPMQRRKA